VTPGSKANVVAEANDLKPLSVRLFRYMRRASSGLVTGSVATLKVSRGARILDAGERGA
jgi:hypothetical protein